MKKICLVIAVSFFCVMVSAQAADNMKAFPPAEESMVRYALQPAEHDDESAIKVELIVGKAIRIDEENNYFFGGKIEKETIKGWGFSRYIVSKLGPMAGSLMAVDPDTPKVDRFIGLGGDAYLIRYNSRLPIVVYVPEGVEVRYRLWHAESEKKAMKNG